MTKDVLVSISGTHVGIVTQAEDTGAQPADSAGPAAGGAVYADDGEVQTVSVDMQENEAVEVVTPASYYCRNGKHYILYDEVVEGMSGTIKNKIKITGTDCLEIMKTGLSNSHMVFEKHKKNLTYYRTPYGQLLVGVNTRNMEISYGENKINILVDYELDINHSPLADCRIKLNIMSKDSGEFSVLS